MTMNISVILPAAGLGRRFAVEGLTGGRASAAFGGPATSGGAAAFGGAATSGGKIEFALGAKPVFLRAIELFYGRGDVEQIILAVHPRKLDEFRFRWGDQLGFLGVKLIAGGEAERWETVQIALEHVSDDATHVAVHDAARPCASGAMIDRVFAAAKRYGAAVPGLAMSDTVKRVLGVGDQTEDEPGGDCGGNSGGDVLDALFGGGSGVVNVVGKIGETVDRSGLYRVQTPQVFEKGLLVEAYAGLNADNAGGVTDDASVVERAGQAVFVVAGDPLNVKLTDAEDVALMEAVLKMRAEKDAKDAAVKQLFGDDED